MTLGRIWICIVESIQDRTWHGTVWHGVFYFLFTISYTMMAFLLNICDFRRLTTYHIFRPKLSDIKLPLLTYKHEVHRFDFCPCCFTALFLPLPAQLSSKFTGLPEVHLWDYLSIGIQTLVVCSCKGCFKIFFYYPGMITPWKVPRYRECGCCLCTLWFPLISTS